MIELIKALVDHYNAMQDPFRARAFEKILPVLNSIKTPDEAVGIRGIGEGIMKRIREAWETGALQELSSQKNTFPGLRLSNKLRRELSLKGINTISGLRQAVHDGTVRVRRAVRIQIEYFDRILRRVPRRMTRSIVESLVVSDPGATSLTVCGSYRRGSATSGDVDILLIHRTRKPGDGFLAGFIRSQRLRFVEHLTPHIDTLRTRYSGIIEHDGLLVRIDIRHIQKAAEGAALLYFTGPASFNRAMRSRAKRLGFKLNEYGLWSKTRRVASSEDEIMTALGLPYIEPRQRNNVVLPF